MQIFYHIRLKSALWNLLIWFMMEKNKLWNKKSINMIKLDAEYLETGYMSSEPGTSPLFSCLLW